MNNKIIYQYIIINKIDKIKYSVSAPHILISKYLKNFKYERINILKKTSISINLDISINKIYFNKQLKLIFFQMQLFYQFNFKWLHKPIELDYFLIQICIKIYTGRNIIDIDYLCLLCYI